MAIFKCKMCGGSLDIAANATVAVCEYCGTKQTLPKLDNEKWANLYDRANHFRRNNEFDKASAIYEQILNEDGTDAEAYWSLVLCCYGIEYVEDPSSRKRVPTVNRAQYTSIYEDDNYKSALQYADAQQKNIYKAEANAINEIQKGILAISQKEDPFDVFICYKESDSNGRRTYDSVLANDLYHQLTQEGFKVFFARITLEDKLGAAYEPYIFAALNSAKVMVVLGTKPEYFNAVWVKNEWSRYLALIKNGAKKMLIPAYRDMDPYDLPEEFSHLQAQDMSKLGFMQDLIRGIKKITQTEAPRPTVVKETVLTGAGNSAVPLLKRAFMFLEDGKWEDAYNYCEKVLDIDPENAQAYVGKLMVELKVRKQEVLKACPQPFDQSDNYQKALRFADKALASELKGYIDFILQRNEEARLRGIYDQALGIMKNASSENAFHSAAELLHSIESYQNAAALEKECLEKAEIARKDHIYQSACANMVGKSERNYESAIQKFETIRGWRDTDRRIHECRTTIAQILAEREAMRIAEKKRSRRRRIITTTVCLAVFACIAIALILHNVIIPAGRYNRAVELMEAGKCEEAISAFEALDGYKDSNTKILDYHYNRAVALMEAGEYEEAISAFEALDGYEDSNTKILDCHYNRAVALMEVGQIDEAYSVFQELGSYKDSATKAVKIRLNKIRDAKIGEYVYYGAYEQDNNTSNGKEEVAWLVLAKEDDKVLVISKYALDCQQFNTSSIYVTWETCSLRKWLNASFLDDAFSSEEQAIIATTTVSADNNPSYSTNPGNATQDKVFLLSITEAKKYFPSDSARKCESTVYAEAQGALSSSDRNCCWLLRSSGFNTVHAANVDFYGRIDEYGNLVALDTYAVRPAMWITIDPE